jgi:hypothetical protein
MVLLHIFCLYDINGAAYDSALMKVLLPCSLLYSGQTELGLPRLLLYLLHFCLDIYYMGWCIFL